MNESLFPPIEIDGITYQDGGMKRHNNPINLALSEARHLWPTSPNPDVLISLGTGSTTPGSVPAISRYRNFLVDGWMSRIYRSFSSSFDGENAWREVSGLMNKTCRESSFRFDLSVPGGLPRLDDTECMARLSAMVHSPSFGISNHKEAATALLTTCFFLKLDSVPSYYAGLFQCAGTIRCRAPAQHVIRCLDILDPSRKDLYKDNIKLGVYISTHDICSHCHKYNRPIRFIVRDLEESIVVSLCFGDKLHRLSAFPNSMQWFVEQQGLNQKFGGSNHRLEAKEECPVCEARAGGVRKRKYIEVWWKVLRDEISSIIPATSNIIWIVPNLHQLCSIVA